MHNKIVLYVDCKEVGTEELGPKGPIDMNGEVAISKLANSQQTFPVSTLNLILRTIAKGVNVNYHTREVSRRNLNYPREVNCIYEMMQIFFLLTARFSMDGP